MSIQRLIFLNVFLIFSNISKLTTFFKDRVTEGVQK